jgi:hypothetical protein
LKATCHRAGCQLEIDRELADRWQPVADLELAGGDHRGDLRAQLLVRWDRTIRVDADDHGVTVAGVSAVAGRCGRRPRWVVP